MIALILMITGALVFFSGLSFYLIRQPLGAVQWIPFGVGVFFDLPTLH